jgi:sigma-B regulation protein RsbU (phosphoserine phosphatase)
MSMLPVKFPPFPARGEFSIFACLEPAREVGGDFYDFFFVDRDRLILCVGDVSGKGVPSALFAAVTKTLLKSISKSDPSVASVVTQVNDEISLNNESCMFVTLLVASLNVVTGEFTYCNAGHNPPIILRADGQIETLDARHGPVAGAMEGTAYGQDEALLSPLDTLVLFTDGVTEATSAKEELYGERRLEELLAGRIGQGPEQLIHGVLESVHGFETGVEQADDITLLTLQMAESDDAAAVKSIRLELQPELSEIDRLVSAFEEFAEANEIELAIVHKLAIAFDELINNVVSYGYREQTDGEPIVVDIDLRQGFLVVTVSDAGVPFNPFARATPDTTLSLSEREIGGLGIHLVQKLMDEVSYARAGRRNVVTLKKNLAVNS